MEVIPAIDIRGGRCVRLAQGDYARETVFDDDPVAVARRWAQQGATRIHVVDLDGARDGKPVNDAVVRAIAAAVPCPVQTGGGIRDMAAMRTMLAGGLDRVVLGTGAVKDRALLSAAVTEAGERLIVSVDARDGRVNLEGWTEATDLDAAVFVAELGALGVRRIVYTDISRDGVAGSPNFDVYTRLTSETAMAVVAAGGVSTLHDLRRLAECGVEGAIVGRALYTGDVDLRAALELAAAC
jgi:phosphoribosylformimino-5-aminoimidazole carboxamide ribotide isomerase